VLGNSKNKGRGKRQADRAEVARRLKVIEQALVRRMSSFAVAEHYATEWGLTMRQIRTYIGRVRKRWREEAKAEEAKNEIPREQMRDGLRMSVNTVFAKAMTKTIVIRDSKGDPIFDPETGRPLTHEAPDLKAAISAARVLMDLDGLSVPASAHIIHSGTVTQRHQLAAKTRVELESWLLGVPIVTVEPVAALPAGNGSAAVLEAPKRNGKNGSALLAYEDEGDSEG
jgi:hypothetical protein